MTLRRTREDQCHSDLMFDRFLAAELAPDATAALEAHVAACARCERRLDSIRKGVAEFSTDLPAELGARADQQTEPRRNATGHPWRRVAPWSVAAVSAAAAILLMASPRAPLDTDPRTGTERTKGNSHVTLYVKHAGQVRPAVEHDRLEPGDAIQFSYGSRTPGYLAVLSVDGARHASAYYPDAPRAAPITAGAAVMLPSSTVLDQVLGDETIHALFCDSPIELGPVRAALEATPTRPPVVAGCTVDTHTFVKVPP